MPLATSHRIEFPGHDGATPLAARLDMPADAPRAYAIFAHCFTCGKDSAAASRISRALAQKGVAVLRFDFTGLGGSEGDFSNTNFSSNIDDLIAAAAYLGHEFQAPQLLVGHSLGGAAVLAAATRLDSVRAVATIGAPADPAHVKHLFERDRVEIEAKGEATVNLAGRKFQIKKQMLDDLDQHTHRERLAKLRKAVIVFHSPQDEIVGISEAGEIYQNLKHPKSFVSLHGADHLLSNKDDSAYVANVLSSWARRYLDDQSPTESHAAEVVVSEAGNGRFTQLVRSGNHRLVADEPTDIGGLDEGPSPYDYLLIGLGACTSMTIRMYARHKGIALDAVSVELDHGKIHARDCEECESKSGKIDRIQRRIHLIGDFTPEQRQRMLEIADRCPVHRTLHGEVLIESELADSDD